MAKASAVQTAPRQSSELARLHGAKSAGLRTILFVCTGNAIRSQMAEALINHIFAGSWAAFSAGTLPRPIHADTVAVLGESGIDATRQFAKHVSLFKNCAFDQVVVLCSDAGRVCPVFPYAGTTDQLAFDDPLWPDVLAGAVVFSYKPRLRDLKAQMERQICAYIDALEGKGAAPGDTHAPERLSWLSACLTLWQRRLRRTTAVRRAPAADRPLAKYQAFKMLLAHNHGALEHMARLESLYYGADAFGRSTLRTIYLELLAALYGIVHAFESLTGRDQPVLLAALQDIDAAIGPECESSTTAAADQALVLPFGAIGQDMKDTVGAKTANLATIGNRLGLPIPGGFVITAHTYDRFLADNGLDAVIEHELADMDIEDAADTEMRCHRIQALIRAGVVAADVAAEIEVAFAAIEPANAAVLRVAMRSSAVGEDTEPTFAGQYETILNVDHDHLLEAYREVLASKYSPQAVCYRLQYGLDDRETPMCVAAVTMVDALASGVVYSRDPARVAEPLLKVNAIWGLGEQLVDGSATPDVFLVDRERQLIEERKIAGKPWRLTARPEGGVALEATSARERVTAAIDDATVLQLADYCLRLEAHFGGPQDIEWAADADGRLFLLQSRPLKLPAIDPAAGARHHYPGHPIVLESGVMAAPGIATGTAFVVRRDEDLLALPDDAILVVTTAAPKYARVAGRIRGLIADSGSATSHLASVAREFGLPAIMDTKIATRTLMTGDHITLAANSVTVYVGIVAELAAAVRPQQQVNSDSPLRRRMRAMLDRITPLNLLDPSAASFTPQACRTCHDVIRYLHEVAMREMFGLSAAAPTAPAVRLRSRLPLSLNLLDLGGGVKATAIAGDAGIDDIACRPLAALWRGLNHPGISWRGTMNTGGQRLANLLAAPATAEFGEQPGGDSYALVAADYLNFSIKFAYHFATVEALCGDTSAQNYIALQFTGGAGSYYGRSLRIQFLAAVLDQLNFEVTTTGDLLQARFARHDQAATDERLDLLGRLLASSKLLDMTLAVPGDIENHCRRFFLGDYDFLAKADPHRPTRLYIQTGRWQLRQDDGRSICVQDGMPFGNRIGTRLAGTLARIAGAKATAFLDNIAAYYYFPLAIARTASVGEAVLRLRLRPVAGRIDRAGGIAFAIRDADNYLVLRINALENNVTLFEFRNGRRQALASADRKLITGLWYDLQVDIRADAIIGSVDCETVLTVAIDQAPTGFIGLWTKADSTIWFDDLTIATSGTSERIAF
jgi:pyruvate,water dikinase